MKLYFKIILLLVSGLCFYNCSLNPDEPDVEYENAWFVLNNYFYFYDKLPASPYKFKTPEELYESVNENYTQYYTPDNSQSIINIIENRKVGMGVKVDSLETGYLITFVVKDSPADKGGLEVNDVILTIDETDVVGATLSEFQNAVVGEEGEVRKITVLRGENAIDISVELGFFISPTVYVDSLNDSTAYIVMTSFLGEGASEGSAKEFAKALESTEKFTHTILDLRNNGGGEINVTIEITSQFVEEGSPIVKVSERVTSTSSNIPILRDTVWKSGVGELALNREFFILMNRYTASASEILISGIMAHRPDIKIVGERSYGKGRGQIVAHQPPILEGVAKVTYSVISQVDGFEYDSIGIPPQIPIEEGGDALEVALSIINPGDTTLSSQRRKNQVHGRYADLKNIYKGEPFLFKRIPLHK